jgi:cell wall-active antibiotic response 4TMS protein YvqF
MQRRQPDQAATIGGVVLVGLGVLFLIQQVLGIDIGRFGWPLFVILPGLGMLAACALAPRSAAGLAIPGCVVTTIGLILAIQNTFDLWQTWAYAWALIPAAVGLGLRLQSEQLNQPRAMAVGTRMFEISLLAFVVFAVFFEFFLDLSHFANGVMRSTVGPALLILAGIYLLMRRRPTRTEP